MSECRKFDKRRLHGFTIVELLIVVVVIAILAAITIVAYNGITSKANDSARSADADTVVKAIEMRYIESSLYGYGATQPATRNDFLNLYNIKPLDTRTIICGYDTCPYSNWDKTKIYISASDIEIDFSYWSNEKGQWKNYYYLVLPNGKPDGDIYYASGPVGMG